MEPQNINQAENLVIQEAKPTWVKVLLIINFFTLLIFITIILRPIVGYASLFKVLKELFIFAFESKLVFLAELTVIASITIIVLGIIFCFKRNSVYNKGAKIIMFFPSFILVSLLISSCFYPALTLPRVRDFRGSYWTLQERKCFGFGIRYLPKNGPYKIAEKYCLGIPYGEWRKMNLE